MTTIIGLLVLMTLGVLYAVSYKANSDTAQPEGTPCVSEHCSGCKITDCGFRSESN